jgi:exonuclease III
MSEKVFEISLVDIPKIKCALACIYRSPQSNAYEFIDKQETLIVKIQQKGNNVILCGDWNINFFTK